MSHSVTVTRTTTTSSATAIILNTGFLRSPGGCLKLFETLIGAICLGLISYYGTRNNLRISVFAGDSEHTLFFLVTFAFLVTTFLILLSSLLSLMSATLIPKTLFELLYHMFAFVFYTAASIALMVNVSNTSRYYKAQYYEGKMAAAVLGLVNSVLYFLSAVFSYRNYKSG